jgi:hypothetical protein
MKQLSPRMTGAEIEIGMQILALRRRVDELETAVRELRAAAAEGPSLPPVQDGSRR